MHGSINDTVTLHNGVAMPLLGFGTYKIADGPEVEGAVLAALESGYRSIDTAAFYGNETGIGRALAQSGVPRPELFIATKVWNASHDYDATRAALGESLSKLGLDYLDLYLIHWPLKGPVRETWRAMEEAYREGRVRAIGVCNFKIHHLKDLMSVAEIRPMVNQFELHPCFVQRELVDFCRKHDIQVESWAPLMRGRMFDEAAVKECAAAHGKTPAQVIIRWALQHRFVCIPKSVHPERIRENADVFDFALGDDEMAGIDALERGERIGPDPDTFV